MKHGLHVYCQKPLTHTVHEARVMARVAAETKVVTQMGTQSSAERNNMRAVELIQSGAIGEVEEVRRLQIARRVPVPAGREQRNLSPRTL